MCGIAGIQTFDSSSRQVSKDALLRMRSVLEHRGPDGEGYWIGNRGRVGLTHRRLSIIDPGPAAIQPITNENGKLQLVFNGEIYNHRELRNELGPLHCWHTDHSDAEVIVHAFEEWGEGCLRHLKGIFALALWDDSKKTLWLARDGFGVKPLYYAVYQGRIAFASEVKALWIDPDIPKMMDEEALYHYLTFMAVPAPMTMFKGVRKVLPGTAVQVMSSGTIVEHSFMQVLDLLSPASPMSIDEASADVLKVLQNAVVTQSSADVPLGVYLSGGVDSSACALLMPVVAKASAKAFTVGFDHTCPSYESETAYAADVAARAGLLHYEANISYMDVENTLREMVSACDEPLGDPVCIATYHIARLARAHGVRVCLSGEGADELFIGYEGNVERMGLINWCTRATKLDLLRAQLIATIQGKTAHRRLDKLRRAQNGQTVFWGTTDVFTDQQKRCVLSDRVNRELAGLSTWDAVAPLWNRFSERIPNPTLCQWMSYIDLSIRLPELMLMRIDKMSMAHGVEVRVPFLDENVVALAARLPDELKASTGTLKYALKTALRNTVPSAVLARRKQGFGAPLSDWYASGLETVGRRTIEGMLANTDVFNNLILDEITPKTTPFHYWSLLVVALWWNQHFG